MSSEDLQELINEIKERYIQVGTFKFFGHVWDLFTAYKTTYIGEIPIYKRKK